MARRRCGHRRKAKKKSWGPPSAPSVGWGAPWPNTVPCHLDNGWGGQITGGWGESSRPVRNGWSWGECSPRTDAAPARSKLYFNSFLHRTFHARRPFRALLALHSSWGNPSHKPAPSHYLHIAWCSGKCEGGCNPTGRPETVPEQVALRFEPPVSTMSCSKDMSAGEACHNTA